MRVYDIWHKFRMVFSSLHNFFDRSTVIKDSDYVQLFLKLVFLIRYEHSIIDVIIVCEYSKRLRRASKVFLSLSQQLINQNVPIIILNCVDA